MTGVLDWAQTHPGLVFLTVLLTVGAAVIAAALTDRRNRP